MCHLSKTFYVFRLRYVDMGEAKIVVPKGLEEQATRAVNDLKERYKVLKKSFGIIKTRKSAKQLKTEIYDELSDIG